GEDQLAVLVGDVAEAPVGDVLLHLEQPGEFFRVETVKPDYLYRAVFLDGAGFDGDGIVDLTFLVLVACDLAHCFPISSECSCASLRAAPCVSLLLKHYYNKNRTRPAEL